ncbi:MAG TPA: hypothetical protein VNC50_13325, partial [Planctomycetia bacterium]|nr:hypothetical protein [Planctomycetia bacterium]
NTEWEYPNFPSAPVPTTPPDWQSSSWPGTPPAPANARFNAVVLLGAGPDVAQLQLLPYTRIGGKNVYRGAIRFGAAGQVYGFTTTNNMLGLQLSPGETGTAVDRRLGGFPVLRLDFPLPHSIPFHDLVQAGVPYSPPLNYGSLSQDDLAKVGISYSVNLGAVEKEQETPVDLPAGIVIDLGYVDPAGVNPPDPSGYRLSRMTPDSRNWDIRFGPNGQVVGSAAADSHLFLWLRETAANVEDIPNAQLAAAMQTPSGYRRAIPALSPGNHAIVAIASRTGLVRSVEPNFGADTTLAATVSAIVARDQLTAGTEFFNPALLYNIYFNDLLAPEGGETGL